LGTKSNWLIDLCSVCQPGAPGDNCIIPPATGAATRLPSASSADPGDGNGSPAPPEPVQLRALSGRVRPKNRFRQKGFVFCLTFSCFFVNSLLLKSNVSATVLE
jgi:hypothetical protein